ncbi:MAG: hypothetical protein V8S14_03095 [Lachnospiraceae bacterium]
MAGENDILSQTTRSDWNSAYNGTGQTIPVNRLMTTGETAGNKIIYNIYANFNPTINATAGTGGTITDNGVTGVKTMATASNMILPLTLDRI